MPSDEIGMDFRGAVNFGMEADLSSGLRFLLGKIFLLRSVFNERFFAQQRNFTTKYHHSKIRIEHVEKNKICSRRNRRAFRARLAAVRHAGERNGRAFSKGSRCGADGATHAALFFGRGDSIGGRPHGSLVS